MELSGSLVLKFCSISFCLLRAGGMEMDGGWDLPQGARFCVLNFDWRLGRPPSHLFLPFCLMMARVIARGRCICPHLPGLLRDVRTGLFAQCRWAQACEPALDFRLIPVAGGDQRRRHLFQKAAVTGEDLRRALLGILEFAPDPEQGVRVQHELRFRVGGPDGALGAKAEPGLDRCCDGGCMREVRIRAAARSCGNIAENEAFGRAAGQKLCQPILHIAEQTWSAP